MELLFLGIVFLVIVGFIALKRPLYQALIAGLAAIAVLFRFGFLDIAQQIWGVFSQWSSFSVLVSLYLITLLARILDDRGQIKLAQQDLNGLFHNRRVNATAAPMVIGLLPSAAAMMLCADIVKDATDDHLDAKEQAFITSWIRHIPESSLPTYTGVLLMASISGVNMGSYMLGMILPVLVLLALAWFPYIHRLPRDPGTPPSENRAADAKNLVKHLWTLLSLLVLILVFGISVVNALLIVILAALMIYRFPVKQAGKLLLKAWDSKLLLSTFLVLLLKGFIDHTGVLEILPQTLSVLPIPTYLIFALLFFLGGIISGSTGIIALGAPIAFAAMEGGMPLMVLLMCMAHAASQISPVHICLVVAAEYYKVSLGELIRKTLPKTLAFCVVSIVYYNLLMLL